MPFRCCAASIERAAEHWFDSGPLVDAVLASSAVPGLLPPMEIAGEHFVDGGIVNSIPIGEAVRVGAKLIFVLQVGRIERPLTVPRRPWEVAQVAFEIARRHRFARELAVAARRCTGARASRPAAATAATTRPGRTGTWRPSGRRISRAYTASRRYLAANVHPLPPAAADAAAGLGPPPGPRARRSCVLAVVLLTTLPVWLLLALAASPLVPGHLRVPRLVFLAIVYLVWDAAALVALAVLWVASGFGWKIRTPALPARPLRADRPVPARCCSGWPAGRCT